MEGSVPGSPKGVSKNITLSFDVGSKNLAYCLIDNESVKILDWNVMDIGAATYDKQCSKLIEALDNIDYSCGYSGDVKQNIIVLIEKQPSLNPKMRVISGQIQMYYALEKQSCLQNDDLTFISKIVYYSPKFKLMAYTPMENDIPIIVKKYSTAYSYRKNLSIQHCNITINRKKDNVLIQDQKWLDFFNSLGSKKDDAADSFNQSLAYIKGL